MSKRKVVVTDYCFKSLDNEKRIISDVGAKFSAYNCKTNEEVIECAKGADILMVQYYEMTADIIETLDNCELIVRYGIGINNIDLDAANRKGILVANVPDYAIEEVSDHTVTLMFSLIRKLPRITESIKEGDWDFKISSPIQRVKGQTLGLVGYGRIPRLLNHKVKNFGFNVLVYDPFIEPEDVDEDGVEIVDLDTLITRSDIISLHAPLTGATRHMFNIDVFEKMKDSAYLINTSRGSLINDDDLIEAIEKGLIAGAAIDVSETEPLSADSKLRRFNNVIVTPHMAWYSERALELLQIKAAECAAKYIKGELPDSVINKKG